MASAMVECLEASVEDFESIWELIQESGDHTDRWVTKKSLKVAAFEERSFEYIIAKYNGKTVGIASLYYLHYYWYGKSMCIDEIVTLKSHLLADDNVMTLLLKKAMEILLKRNGHTLCLILLQSDLSKLPQLGGEVEAGLLILRIPKVAMNQFAKEKSELNEHYLIRAAVKEDIPSLLYLIQCLAVFQEEPLMLDVNEKMISEDAFDKKQIGAIVIEADTTASVDSDKDIYVSSAVKMPHNPLIVGMVLYYTFYCKRRGKVLHFTRLFVKERHRKQGLGTELMRECTKKAIMEGCEEINGKIDKQSTKVIKFYKELGGVLLTNYATMNFSRDCLLRLLKM